MIGLFIFLFLAGGALFAYGIWEKKNIYNEQHFTEGEVVGHQAVRTGNLTMTAVSKAVGIVHPVVLIDLPDGSCKEVKLHTQVSKMVFQKFPELDVGGKVSVTYYGHNPKEAFLTAHPLAQKPMAVSAAMLIGVAILAVAVLLLIFYFTVDI